MSGPVRPPSGVIASPKLLLSAVAGVPTSQVPMLLASEVRGSWMLGGGPATGPATGSATGSATQGQKRFPIVEAAAAHDQTIAGLPQ